MVITVVARPTIAEFAIGTRKLPSVSSLRYAARVTSPIRNPSPCNDSGG